MAELTPEQVEQMDEAALRKALLQRLESPAFSEVRAQLREAQKELKQAPERIRAEMEFEQEFASSGLPASVKSLVQSEMEQGESITEVAERLELTGLAQSQAPTVEGEGAPAPEPAPSPVASEMAAVSNLGSQVAQAAKTSGGQSLTDRINAAETPEELAAVMSEAQGQ